MKRIEIPNSLNSLRRINGDAYVWYLHSVLPAIDELTLTMGDTLQYENPGLELMLQESSPWPFLLGFAIEQGSQFRVKVAGEELSLRPINESDIATLKRTCHSIEKTTFDGRKISISHPRIGIAASQSPLTVRFPVVPQMKSWIFH